MSASLLIYGATGYSGRLVTHALVALGLRPILAGRNPAKLVAMAEQMGLAYRVAGLGEPDSLDAALRDVAVVLHTAGPFSETYLPMLDACLRTGTHYLDITGEVPVIEALARRHADAVRHGIMVMPGVGFDVVPTDCLAAHVALRLPGAWRLALGVSGLAPLVTRGSARTLFEAVNQGVVRRQGLIAPAPLGSLQRRFDYGAGPRRSVNVSWGDIASAYYTTGIPDIEVYLESTPLLEAVLASSRYLGWMWATGPWQAWFKASTELIPEGPTADERAARRTVVVAEAEDRRGRRVISRLRAPEAYTVTGIAAAAVAQRVLGGDLEVGFQTPARVYGADFVLSLPDVVREDLE